MGKESNLEIVERSSGYWVVGDAGFNAVGPFDTARKAQRERASILRRDRASAERKAADARERDAQRNIHGDLTRDEAIRCAAASTLHYHMVQLMSYANGAAAKVQTALNDGKFREASDAAVRYDVVEHAGRAGTLRSWIAYLIFGDETAEQLQAACVRDTMRFARDGGPRPALGVTAIDAWCCAEVHGALESRRTQYTEEAVHDSYRYHASWGES